MALTRVRPKVPGRTSRALIFSGPRVLSVEDIAQVVLGPVLNKKPLELYIPRRLGWLSRFADLFPATAFLIRPLLEKRGRARQKTFDAGQSAFYYARVIENRRIPTDDIPEATLQAHRGRQRHPRSGQ